jgi:hypothetical protein
MSRAPIRVFIVPDVHAPFHDKRAVKTTLQAIPAFKPDRLVFLGDGPDCYEISDFAKDPARKLDFNGEMKLVNQLWDKFDAVKPKESFYILGNHEDRLSRFIAKRAPELHGFVSIEQIMRLRERGYEITKYGDELVMGRLRFSHEYGQTGPYCAKKSRESVGHNIVFGHCLPQDYEVATTAGWVLLSDITTSHLALTFRNGQVATSPIRDVVRYNYSGEMICFDNSSISQEMTDRHHIFTADGRYLPIQEALETVQRCDLVHQAQPLIHEDELPISDDEIRLAVAYAADGSLDRARYVRFHLKKARKIERLDQLLGAVGVDAVWGPVGKNGGRKLRALPRDLQDRLIELVPDKALPAWLLRLSSRQRQVVIDELPLWDGSHLLHDGVDYSCYQFASSKQIEIELVQMLLLQHGIRSTMHRKRKGGAMVVCYNLNKQSLYKTPLSALAVSRQVTRLPVGCIETDDNNFWVRTPEGSVELTGNSHRAQCDYGGLVTGERHVAWSMGWLGDYEQLAFSYKRKWAARRDWVLGFGTAIIEPGGNCHVRFHPIINGRVEIDGKIIGARER